MDKLLKKYYFYLYPFLLISILNTIFFICFGTYFEDYEKVISSNVLGVYSKPLTSYYDITNHYLIMWVYEYISRFFPDIQVYGRIMFLYNWISLTLLGLVLYRVLKVNISKMNSLLFIFLYGILTIDSFVNLSSTRIAFNLIATALIFIESCRLENKKITNYQWTLLSFFFLFVSLIRPEAVLLFSLIYIGILILYKRYYMKSLLPLIISLLVFICINLVVTFVSSEAKQVFVYKEKEILDRNNINYTKLTPALALEVEAFTHYGIHDKEHLTLAFYDHIASSKSEIGLQSIKDGITIPAFFSTLRNTIAESFSSVYLILFYIVSGIIIISSIRQNRSRYILLYLFTVLLPFLLCLHTIVPMRFLVPYFSIAVVLNILFYIKAKEINKLIFFFSFLFILAGVLHATASKNSYLKLDKKFKDTRRQLQSLIKNQPPSNLPVIINNFDYESSFPVNPLDKIPHQPALFLNYFYFSAYDFYVDSWKEVCHCSSLSLKEKVDYIVSSGNLFIIQEDSFQFLKRYFKQKYQLELNKKQLGKFQDLQVCKLSYGANQ